MNVLCPSTWIAMVWCDEPRAVIGITFTADDWCANYKIHSAYCLWARVRTILHAIKINPKSFSNDLHTQDAMNAVYFRVGDVPSLWPRTGYIKWDEFYLLFLRLFAAPHTATGPSVHEQQSTACRFDDKYYTIKLERMKRGGCGTATVRSCTWCGCRFVARRK